MSIIVIYVGSISRKLWQIHSFSYNPNPPLKIGITKPLYVNSAPISIRVAEKANSLTRRLLAPRKNMKVKGIPFPNLGYNILLEAPTLGTKNLSLRLNLGCPQSQIAWRGVSGGWVWGSTSGRSKNTTLFLGWAWGRKSHPTLAMRVKASRHAKEGHLEEIL